MRRRRRWMLVAACAALVSPIHLCAADPTGRTLTQLRTVMLSEENFDGRVNQFLGSASRFSLNNRGRVAFVTYQNSVPYLWAETDAGRVFHRAPNSEPVHLYLTDAGNVIFGTTSSAGGTLRPDGIWKWTGEQLQQLVGVGMPVTDESGMVLEGYQYAGADLQAVHSSGALAFSGGAEDVAIGIGGFGALWQSGDPGAVPRLALRLGSDAPGLGGGTRFVNSTAFSVPRINSQAHGILNIQLEGPDVVTNVNEDSMWIYRDGQLEMLYRQGDFIPDTNDEYRFGFFSTGLFGTPSINDHGSFSFISTRITEEGQITPVLWAQRDGKLEPVVLSGDPVADQADGVAFGNLAILTDAAINADDAVAFRTQVTGEPFVEGAFGLFIQDNDRQLHTAVLNGTSMPELRPDAVIRVPRDMGFQFNGRGQLAFAAPFHNGSPEQLDDIGIFVYDTDLSLKAIAVVGDAIEVAPDDVRIIEWLWMPNLNGGNQDGISSLFNEQGQILFQAGFTDGTSGLFLSNAAAIPEPCAAWLLTVGMALLMSRRRNSRQ